jgi:hypothetical protein
MELFSKHVTHQYTREKRKRIARGKCMSKKEIEIEIEIEIERERERERVSE